MTTFQKKIVKIGNLITKLVADDLESTWTGVFRITSSGVVFELDHFGDKDYWYVPYTAMDEITMKGDKYFEN